VLELIKVLVERIDEHDVFFFFFSSFGSKKTIWYSEVQAMEKPSLSSSIQAYAFEGVFTATVIKIEQFLDHSFTIIVSVHFSSVKMLLQHL
jgi:hypothetical protein